MPPISPIDLLEIRSIIRQYLDGKDLVACVQVNRKWHNAFLPFILKSMTLHCLDRDAHRNPPPAYLRRNEPYVRRVCFLKSISLEHSQRLFINLRNLTLDFRNGLRWESDSRLATFLRFHPWIQHLSLRHISIAADANMALDFWTACAESFSPPLISLTLSEVSIGGGGDPCIVPLLTAAPISTGSHPDVVDAFWQACSKPEKVVLERVYERFGAPRSRSLLPDTRISFNNVKELSVLNCGLLSEREQLQLLARCRLLDSLGWHVHQREYNAASFAFVASQGVWPRLQALNLRRPVATDKELATILGHMGKVSVLSAKESLFGQLSFAVMRKHFHILVELDLSRCSGLTAAMTQGIMVSCPALKSFEAFEISGTEVMTSKGRPWACRNLHTLAAWFHVEATDPEAYAACSQAMCGQIAMLKQLRCLNISGTGTHSRLQLKLGQGLELLTGLKLLENLKIGIMGQNLDMAEILWMCEHWKRLEIVQGMLDTAFEKHKEMAKLLRTAGVEVNS